MGSEAWLRIMDSYSAVACDRTLGRLADIEELLGKAKAAFLSGDRAALSIYLRIISSESEQVLFDAQHI